MERRGHFPKEMRERAVRMLVESTPEQPSQWAAIPSVAAKLGCSAEALRKWVRQAERDSGVERG